MLGLNGAAIHPTLASAHRTVWGISAMAANSHQSRTLRPRRSMRHLQQILLSIAVLAAVLILSSCGGTGVTKSVNDSAYFYRLQAQYSHGDEPIDIDVVVGCSVRVTESRGGDSGFLAAIFPRFYVQQTRDGHEVMQILPLICRGQTTKNGRVPPDFLPGIIWFDKGATGGSASPI
jgi:hypothetical protein